MSRNSKKRCFVIQGYGKKQDYEQGKQFDLDASYAVIKEAVESAGIDCFRGDELRTNAIIDQIMYDQLLDADLVIADITTLNFNAAFELGVRFALRPYATLVVGEEGVNFPFDLNHVFIHKYTHLGEDIGYGEVKRFQAELKKLVKEAVSNNHKDSPVYTFLTGLPEQGFIELAGSKSPSSELRDTGVTLREIIDKANKQMKAGKFEKAIKSWTRAKKIAGKNDYIIQQLALGTYKSEQPDSETALRKAESILDYLKPHESYDMETLGLWAAVHKRLFEISKDTHDLDEAIFALERGYYINKNHYNGINLTFLLDVKAKNIDDVNLKKEARYMARHIRREVKEICNDALSRKDLTEGNKYWIRATLYESCVGLGENKEALQWKTESAKLASAEWMIETTENQITRLRTLLKD